ncbi:MAG: CsbD family protein [Acetobacteraceae bacterium]|nr:CsbD family protein [Acetobacteraceae bacterium]
MSDRFEGTAREMGGHVQETVGKMTGDTKTQADGLYNQAAGQAQQTVAQVSDVIKAQPIAAVVIAVGLGYILGRLTA